MEPDRPLEGTPSGMNAQHEETRYNHNLRVSIHLTVLTNRCRADKSLFSSLPIDRSKRMLRLWKFIATSNANDHKIGQKISLEMEVFPAEDCPCYIALSYLWGSYDDTNDVRVNGHTVRVTRNLHDFLAILHNAPSDELPYEESMWFWADQISLNQFDAVERNHQVSLMGEIYSHATEVFAYIGTLPTTFPMHRFVIRVYQPPESWRIDDEADRDAVRTVLYMLTEKYWSRLWIVQELLLAKKITIWYGKFFVRSTVLALAMVQELPWKQHITGLQTLNTDWKQADIEKRCLLQTLEQQKRVFALLRGHHTLSHKDSDGFSLTHLDAIIDQFYDCECQDSRDKIFGLQALVMPTERIPIDYTIDREQLNVQVLRQLVLNLSTANSDLTFLRRFAEVSRKRVLCDKLVESIARSSGRFEYFRGVTAALIWSRKLALLPMKLADLVASEWTRLMWVEIQNAEELWYECWESLSSQAATQHQQRLGESLRDVACRDALHVQISEMAVSIQRLAERPEDKEAQQELRRLMATSCSKIEQSARKIINDALRRHGFVVYGQFVYHPEEWPFREQPTGNTLS